MLNLPVSASNTPVLLYLCFIKTPISVPDICHISHTDTADTDPVLCASGSLLQSCLQPCTKAPGPAKLLHYPAGVAELIGGQQGLQAPEVTLQRLDQRGHRLRGHR